MFGELDDSDIYEENQGNGFGGSSDSGFSGYDGFADANEETNSFDSNVNFEQSGVLGANYGDEQLAVPSQGDEVFSGNSDYNQEQPPKKAKAKMKPAVLYVLILAVLFAGAVGMFFFKQNATQSLPPSGQAMGDYFYDQAAGTKPDGAATGVADSGTATVEVDLGTTAAPEVAPSVASSAQPEALVTPSAPASAVDKIATPVASKPMNALEKAMAKQKADSEKENALGLGKSVVVSVSGGGRVDPFLPFKQSESLANGPKFDLIAPPLEIPVQDPVVDELMATKISGIMYDKVRPSAIVNFGADDQLVHTGDVVKGFKIVGITKNSVVIKYGTNVYQATVGQTLSEGINLNPVSSISRQFGGAYAKTPKNVIQFNN